MNLRIHALAEADFDRFATYLNRHLSDNGAPGTGYFQPMPRQASFFSAPRMAAFREALGKPLPGPGWRRAWVVVDDEEEGAQGAIAGHIDLRAWAEPHTEHRCLLGMGVDKACRRAGLGQALLSHALSWAREEAGLEWVDLQVLASNERARRLYARAGFEPTGLIPAMFKIDGQVLDYVAMSRRLGD
ncbi:RimJ/RimL family protein N-acetyltransferase [Paucibacter oligotrophus]|uniref:RimJ/RimL family protein N-acetyltransferase n=1 Tax=Roseateles oligotrophus TaxID=1769250 RepID=A0A840L889_9BURK|nr:GNAT family N-acetyltransferase [Roseateles oligotrophus]MBB4842905.1 RimJ/RimL family protein N-acetyltransferase [Roseateles oligotrophus]